MRIPAQTIHSSFLLLPFIVFTCSEDKWDPNSCPKNLSTYADCRIRVSAIFESAAHKCPENNDYSFSIQVNTVIPAVSDVESVGVNDSDSVCMVSGYIEAPKVSYRHVTFIAQYIADTVDPYHVNCDDSILVKDGIDSPSFSNISKTCEGIYFEWIGPDLLPGFEVSKFNLYILGTNITNETVDTSILIPYDDLEYNKEYNISLSASYCAGQGNAIFETFFTATAPKVDAEFTVAVHIQNADVANITFIAKVCDAECVVSYPTNVQVEITCTKMKPHHEELPVSVNEDGTITFNIKLPVDRGCNGFLEWKKKFPSVQPSMSKTSFTTNQLQKCNFWVDEDEILVTCYYAKGSTLKGCQGVATHQLTGYNYTNEFRAQFGGGDIPVMCAGVYNVTCYGLKIGSTNSVTGYSGSLYNSILTVTSGSSCIHETPTPSPVTSITFISLPAIVDPKNINIETKIIEITVPVFVICIIIIIALSIVSVIFIVLYAREKMATSNQPHTGEESGDQQSMEETSFGPRSPDEESPTEEVVDQNLHPEDQKLEVVTVKGDTRNKENDTRHLLDSLSFTDLGNDKIGEQRTDKDAADINTRKKMATVNQPHTGEAMRMTSFGPRSPDEESPTEEVVDQNLHPERDEPKEEDETQCSVNSKKNIKNIELTCTDVLLDNKDKEEKYQDLPCESVGQNKDDEVGNIPAPIEPIQEHQKIGNAAVKTPDKSIGEPQGRIKPEKAVVTVGPLIEKTYDDHLPSMSVNLEVERIKENVKDALNNSSVPQVTSSESGRRDSILQRPSVDHFDQHKTVQKIVTGTTQGCSMMQAHKTKSLDSATTDDEVVMPQSSNGKPIPADTSTMSCNNNPSTLTTNLLEGDSALYEFPVELDQQDNANNMMASDVPPKERKSESDEDSLSQEYFSESHTETYSKKKLF